MMNLASALLNVRQMTEADRLAVAAGIPGVVLMENAGRAVAKEIQRRWPARPVAVLCGPGNNGGDGFVIARVLAEAGWPVRLGLLCQFDRLTGDAHQHAERWQGKIEPLTPELLDGVELVVDAIFGAGLSRALHGAALEILAAVARQGLPMVAVDVPSGVLGDTGESLGAVPAALTVTFLRKKPGHLLQLGRRLCGELVVADIGIPATVLELIAPDTFENDPALWQVQLPPAHDRSASVSAPRTVQPDLLIFTPDEIRRHFGWQGDVLADVRSAAKCSVSVIVLAGDDTVIAAPDGRVIIQGKGLAAMTTTNSIHMIQDIASTLMSKGMEPFLAAAAAAWQHNNGRSLLLPPKIGVVE